MLRSDLLCQARLLRGAGLLAKPACCEKACGCEAGCEAGCGHGVIAAIARCSRCAMACSACGAGAIAARPDAAVRPVAAAAVAVVAVAVALARRPGCSSGGCPGGPARGPIAEGARPAKKTSSRRVGLSWTNLTSDVLS